MKIKAKILDQQDLKVRTNTFSATRLGNFEDIDTTVLLNGSVLVYNTTTQKWTSTITLEAQVMEGGEF
jgi:hypothetical protein